MEGRLTASAVGKYLLVHAAEEKPVPPVDAGSALNAARLFVGGGQGEYVGLVREDRWTHSRGLHAHRSLHAVEMGDAAHTITPANKLELLPKGRLISAPQRRLPGQSPSQDIELAATLPLRREWSPVCSKPACIDARERARCLRPHRSSLDLLLE